MVLAVQSGIVSVAHFIDGGELEFKQRPEFSAGEAGVGPLFIGKLAK